MNLISIRGGNRVDLENRGYTIGIGISLGNKWFTVENILGLIEWALIYSKEKVIVYVADSIHAINLEVRNEIGYETALRKANKQGDLLLAEVRAGVERKFSPEQISRILYVKWDDISDVLYQQKVRHLKFLYDQNNNFRDTIISLVKEFTAKEKRNFSEKEILRLGEYILEELPEVINRTPMKGVVCDAYTYPFDGKLPELVEEIQNGKRFLEIKKEIMDTKPKVFLEVR